MDVTAPTPLNPVSSPTSSVTQVTDPEILTFLEGHNPLAYVVAIEVPGNESRGVLTIQPPNEPARQERLRYRPFLYMKDLRQAGRPFYGGDAKRRSDAMAKHQITIKKLRVTDANGAVNERLANGYCYQVFSDAGRGHQGLANFFQEGGYSLWNSDTRKASYVLRPPESLPAADVLYSELEGEKGCALLYNHQTNRYEVHVEARFVNTRNLQDEQAEDDFFIRLKAEGKEPLKLDQDFEYYYDEANEQYVLSLLPEAEKPRKTRKQKDGTYLEVPTPKEEIAQLQGELVEVCRLDHPLLVDQVPAELTDEAAVTAALEAALLVLKAAGLWGKVQDRERAVHVKARKLLMTANNKVYRRIALVEERLLKAPSRKANVHDPRYTVSKLTVEYRTGYSDFFYQLKPAEQLMVQHGIRLFKGFERYADVHKLDFDLETTSLFPRVGRIFLIGERDNRGYENVWEPAKLNDDAAEAAMIVSFLTNLGKLRPAVIKGYNSENFDWNFLEVRCELLGIPFCIPDWYGKTHAIERRPGATLKLGGDSEVYTQTLLVGTSVIDVMHAARRVKAVTSDMERYTLKYVCQYEGIAKPNRMYIADGRLIFRYWELNEFYLANAVTNAYERVPDAWQPIIQEAQTRLGYPAGYARGRNPSGSLGGVPAELVALSGYGTDAYLTSGRAIVYQYLLDDLWETNQVDEIYNEDRFQMAKWMPTSFTRTATMGGSTAWNLMMTVSSYAHNLAIPYSEKKYRFTGGLSRMLRIGKFGTVEKVDFSGLYPSLKLQYEIFPLHDVLDVRRRYLAFFTKTRTYYKSIAGDESRPELERNLAKARSAPLKINNNSEFGAGGSPFDKWNHIQGAWETTCRGRQYLRGMVAFFMRYGCVATVLDTDGVNFEVPEELHFDINAQPTAPYPIAELRYVAVSGKVSTGFAALVARYNDVVLGNKPFMKLDLEAYWPAAVNISRKNYANLEVQKDPKKPPKIKFVGNSIKDNNMPGYIKLFIQKGVRMLLNNQGEEFVQYYYEHLTRIYLMQIPLKLIAKKGKVKLTPAQYQTRGTDRNGRPKARQAHMELILQDKLQVDLGEAVYYVATGTKKSESETTIDKATGKLMASAYREDELERDPDLTVPYNVQRYVAAFNAKVKLLLCVFGESVRNSLLKVSPTERNYYTAADLLLINYENPKDPLSEFFRMEESEVRFWNLSGLDPYEMYPDFTTAVPYDGHYYARKLRGVSQLMGKQGSVVRSYRERYLNGELVLGFERTLFAVDPASGNQCEVPALVQPYLHGNGLPVLTNALYQQVRHYRRLYGPLTELRLVRRYPLSEVVGGALVPLMVLYDAVAAAEPAAAVAQAA